LNNNPKDF